MVTRERNIGGRATLDPFDVDLGSRLRALRHRRGLTSDDVARCVRAMGVRWESATVRLIEVGGRSVSARELLLLPAILGCQIEDLAPDSAVTVSVDTGKDDDSTRLAARRLGVDVSQVAEMSDRLWGRSLHAEREARLSRVTDGSMRTTQARRGRITRKLMVELRREISRLAVHRC